MKIKDWKRPWIIIISLFLIIESLYNGLDMWVEWLYGLCGLLGIIMVFHDYWELSQFPTNMKTRGKSNEEKG